MPIDLRIDRERHALVKYELSLRGLSLAEIGRRAGVGTSAVSSVSLGKSRSARVERFIAEALEVPVEDLFADRYPDITKGKTMG